MIFKKFKKQKVLYNSTDTIMENIRNRQHILQLNHRAHKQKLNKSIKLGSLNRQKKSILTPASKATLANSESILSSVSRKLQPENISTISRINDLQSVIDKKQVRITCMVDFDSVSLMSFMSQKNQVSFKQILKKLRKQNKNSLISDLHQNKKDKKGCFETNCNVKKRWLKNIVFYQRQVKNLMIVKQKLPFLNSKILQQINKDVPRSFPENMFPKTKLTVYHAASQKISMLQTLKTVLKLYAIFDQPISYIQGINLIAASIITHVKDVDSSFIIFKELMNYGKLRNFYLNDFQFLKKQSNIFFHNYLKNWIYQLYEHFMEWEIDPLTLMPAYYTCLFASTVDITYIHIIIDQYFMEGIIFLHKFFLSLLFYLKDQLIISGQQTQVKLGSTYLKNLQIPWNQIIEMTQYFKDI